MASATPTNTGYDPMIDTASYGDGLWNLSVNATALVPINHSVPCTNDYCMDDEEYFDMVWAYIFPTSYEWALICLYIAAFFVGLVGNFLVSFAVWRNHSMRTVTNYFIVNLSVADFLVLLICLPPTVLDDVTETWYMGSVMCRIVKYLQGVSVSVSVLTLTCISIERWYAICHPLLFRATPQRARLMILVIWAVSLCLIVPDLVVLDTRAKFPGVTVLLTACRPAEWWADTSQAAYQLFLSVAMFLMPFILMFVLYVQIAQTLWSNAIPTETSRDQLHPSESRSGVESQLIARRKAAKMLIAVVVMFGICYLPVHLLNLLRYGGVMKHLGNSSTYMALVAHWMCYFNSAINPCIYNFMSAKFRREFREMCCGWCSCKSKPSRPRRDAQFAYRYTNHFDNRNHVAETASNCDQPSRMTHC